MGHYLLPFENPYIMFYAPFVILTLMFAPRWLLWLFGLLLAAGAGALWGSWKLFRRIVFGQKR